MKKCLSLILAILVVLALVACGKETESAAPTTELSESIAPRESVGPSQPADSELTALSDRELIGKMIESRKLETPSVSAVVHTDEYWMLWLVQNCDPFWELLSRESGLDSLKTMGLEVAEEYEDSMFCSFSAGRMKNWLLPMLFPELFMEISE